MAIDLADTVRLRLARTHRQRDKRLLESQEQLDQRAAKENNALQKAQQRLYDEALVPSRAILQRLKHVDLIELAAIERPTVAAEAIIDPRQPRKITVPTPVKALGGVVLVVAVPLAVGHVTQAVAYRAVRNFGSDSTGKAIKTLHGAAARSATFARFGRGSIVTGGGGVAAGEKRLSELGKTSAELTHKAVLKCQIQMLSDGRQEKARDLELRERKMSEKQDAAPALYERSKDMQRILQCLRSELVRRLPSLTALVETCDDLARYDSRQRAEVAAMVELDGLAVMVMECSIIGMEGRMTEEWGRVASDAEARLRVMETEG
ncbi:hypothetical protein [Streptomyces poriferorum]|uniref:Uncharacterized protein n=1 Tax=Streptomyces poriferorum TaxID=2798799 RepID=A0ABY9IKY8_9ACTN|nr:MULTISPECIES: hypothetical protein [unclassified Streptomyces]MDP5315364.1 hypothetical protein [Streptomyces sp. Alt4]WLQ55780.1 hypothetical protein P8A19_10115 [Streptomyces sp. Alt2]